MLTALVAGASATAAVHSFGTKRSNDAPIFHGINWYKFGVIHSRLLFLCVYRFALYDALPVFQNAASGYEIYSLSSPDWIHGRRRRNWQ